MVNSTVFRRATRHSVFAALASVASLGLVTGQATAQFGSPAIPIGEPVPEFSLSDIPLAEGEQIVSSSTGEGGPVIHYGGTAYKTIDSSAVPNVANGLGYESPMSAAGLPGVGGCASGKCGSSSCGNAACGGKQPFGPGVDLGGNPRLGSGGNVCGPTCNPYSYGLVEALYMKNDDLNSEGVPAPFNLSDFDYEFGARVTFGMVPDCRNGYEVSFIGPFEWTSTSQRASGANDIDAFLTAGAPFIVDNLSTFFDAESAVQLYEAEFLSFEFNRTMIGWDVIKLLYGMRYVQYDEDYIYSTVRTLVGPPGLPGAGLLRSATENRMLGAQLGIDMTYPLTCRTWTDFRGRAGVFGNFAENRFQVNNAGNIQVFNEADDVALAGMLDISGGLRYYVTNNFHIRGGGELWYLTEVATATKQFGGVITPSTGRNINVGDSIFMFGASVGAELKF